MNLFKFLISWKYRYFLRKLRGVRSMILDMEFKRFKTKEIREEVRQTYDMQKARLLSIETTIKNEREKANDDPSKMPEADLARLDDDVVRLKQEIERYEAQLRGLDIDVHGTRPTNELPEGHNGLDQQLDSLRELEGMIRDYARSI